MIDPAEYGVLRNLYWKLRSVRGYDQAGRRKWYRRIKVERNRLVGIGFGPEHVRLYCRFLADPSKREREEAIVRYENMVTEWARLQGVFGTTKKAVKKEVMQVGLV